MSTPEQRAKMRRLAEKATPGPWMRHPDVPNAICAEAEPDLSLLGLDKDGAAIVFLPIDAEYVAEANPQAILSLLDELKAAEARIAELESRKPEEGREDRPETGKMQFGDDWPGVFIRGDNALMWAKNLNRFINDPEDMTAATSLAHLARVLRSCDAFAPPAVSEAKEGSHDVNR